MSEQVTIYALCEPDDGAVRYVGQTRGPLDMRLRQHGSDGGRSAKAAWIAQMAAKGQRPAIVALETVCATEADAAERRHIARLKQDGADLTNAAVQPRTRLSQGIVVHLTPRRAAKLERLARREELPVAWAVLGPFVEREPARLRAAPPSEQEEHP